MSHIFTRSHRPTDVLQAIARLKVPGPSSSNPMSGASASKYLIYLFGNSRFNPRTSKKRQLYSALISSSKAREAKSATNTFVCPRPPNATKLRCTKDGLNKACLGGLLPRNTIIETGGPGPSSSTPYHRPPRTNKTTANITLTSMQGRHQDRTTRHSVLGGPFQLNFDLKNTKHST